MASNTKTQSSEGKYPYRTDVLNGNWIKERQAKIDVFVKYFGDELNDETLQDMFKKFGKITSHKLMSKDDGKNRSCGFVTFECAEAAEAAVDGLNGRELGDGKVLYVRHGQKKAERKSELKRKFEQLKIERLNHYHGVNLYVKNLDETIDDDRLRKEFHAFGTITSAKVMMEDGRSRGFGFVCFSDPEEAMKAVTDMNGRFFGSKPWYVALAQRKDEQKAQLTSQYMNRNRIEQPQRFYETQNMCNSPTQTVYVVYYETSVQAVHIKGQEPLTATMIGAAQPAEQKERLFPVIPATRLDNFRRCLYTTKH